MQVVPATWHVINDQDAVARAPKFLVLFKRTGQRVIINHNGDMLVRPSFIEASIHKAPGGAFLFQPETRPGKGLRFAKENSPLCKLGACKRMSVSINANVAQAATWRCIPWATTCAACWLCSWCSSAARGSLVGPRASRAWSSTARPCGCASLTCSRAAFQHAHPCSRLAAVALHVCC